MGARYQPAFIAALGSNLVDDSAAEFVPRKLGGRFQGVGFTLLVSADSVTIILHSRSGLGNIGGRAGWVGGWRRNRARGDGDESGRRVDLGAGWRVVRITIPAGTRRGGLRVNRRADWRIVRITIPAGTRRGGLRLDRRAYWKARWIAMSAVVSFVVISIIVFTIPVIVLPVIILGVIGGGDGSGSGLIVWLRDRGRLLGGRISGGRRRGRARFVVWLDDRRGLPVVRISRSRRRAGVVILLDDRGGLPMVRVPRSRTRVDSFGRRNGLVLELGLGLENSNIRNHRVGRASDRGR